MPPSPRLAAPLATLCLGLVLSGAPGAVPRGEIGPRELGSRPGAEDPAAARTRIGELMRAARERRSTHEERVAAMEALLAMGPEGAGALAPQIEREAARARRDYESAQPRFLRAFERAALRIVAARQSRDAQREVAERRAQILAGLRDPRLSGERIREVSDPAVRRLEELLAVDTHDVFDAEPERFDELAVLLDLLLEQRALHAMWKRAHALLVEHGATSRARMLAEPRDPEDEEEALHRELDLLALLATPMGGRDADVLRANRALAADPALGIDPEEAAGIEHLNRVRILCGLAALATDPRLCDASRDHSRDMVELGFFSHTSPVKGKESVGRRAANFGTSAHAENIAAGHSTGAGAISAWWYSPGHHRNLLGNHGRVGLGHHEGTWTQKLG